MRAFTFWLTKHYCRVLIRVRAYKQMSYEYSREGVGSRSHSYVEFVVWTEVVAHWTKMNPSLAVLTGAHVPALSHTEIEKNIHLCYTTQLTRNDCDRPLYSGRIR